MVSFTVQTSTVRQAAKAIFCNIASFSPSRRLGMVLSQTDQRRIATSHRYGAQRVLAYFQPATNTHAHPSEVALRGSPRPSGGCCCVLGHARTVFLMKC